MKNCPRCAEEVQDAAKACKHCGHEFGFQLPKVGCFGTAILAVVILWAASQLSPSTSADPVATVTPYSQERVADCGKIISQGKKAGLIRSQPDSNRINVDDRLWADFPADAKRGILLSLGCSAFGRPMQSSDYVVAYGYRSGKRLAMATSVGVNFE